MVIRNIWTGSGGGSFRTYTDIRSPVKPVMTWKYEITGQAGDDVITFRI